MPIEKGHFAQVQVVSPLQGSMFPFHPDTQNRIPSFITNGSIGKAPFAVAAGLPLLRSEAVKAATSAAEDEYHLVHGDGVIGPAIVDGRPYPLALALQKLMAAREVLRNDGREESFFTQDTAYRVRIPGSDVDVTIHKPKGPEDVGRLVAFLNDAALSGRAELSSVSGLARWDEVSQTIEGYTGSTVLGTLQPFDTAVLENRLTENGHISMGTQTFDVPGFLVPEAPVIKTVIYRYSNGEIVEPQVVAGCMRLRQEGHVETGTADPLNVQLAGLGFFQR